MCFVVCCVRGDVIIAVEVGLRAAGGPKFCVLAVFRVHLSVLDYPD